MLSNYIETILKRNETFFRRECYYSEISDHNSFYKNISCKIHVTVFLNGFLTCK